MIYYIMTLSSLGFPLIHNNKKIYCFLMFSFMAIVAGIRAESVGTDTHMYNDYASWYPKTTWEEFFFNESSRKAIEIGIFFLMKVASELGDVQWFIFFSSCITMFLLGLFIYRNFDDKYCWVSVFVILTFGFFFYSLNVLRQSMAIALSLYAYDFFIREKYIKSFFVLLLTSLFHYSVLILIPVFIVMMIYTKMFKINNPVYGSLITCFGIIALIIIAYMIIINNLELVGSTYAMYFLASSGYGFEDSAGRYSYVMVIFTISIVLFSGFLKINDKQKMIFYFCDVMLLLSLIFIFAQMNVMVIFYRFIDTFSIYFCILIPNLIKAIRKPVSKFTFTSMVVIFGFINMAYMLMKGLHQVTEYKVFF